MDLFLPLLGGLLAWWIGTGLLFVLARASHRGDPSPLLAGATVVALAAGAVTLALRPVDSPAGAALGFAMAVLLWGWHEFAFLSGVVTGPERRPCPPELRGWRRFRFGFRSVRDHELALAATVVVLGAASWGAANASTFLAFSVLWAMRVSAKLNLFAGVPFPNRHLFPPRLRHLAALVPRRRPGGFYLGSVLLVVAATVVLFMAAAGATDPGVRTAFLLSGTLAALALLEHLAMVIPLRLEGLWGLESEEGGPPTPGSA
jgi:putative photosynthetic complex assembly protein 2